MLLTSIPDHGFTTPTSKRNWRDLNDLVRSRMILKGSQCSDFSPLHTLLENAFMPNVFDRKRIYKADAKVWHWTRFAANLMDLQEVYGTEDLVDDVMIFLDSALKGSHDLFVIKVAYGYMLPDNTTEAGHSMLLVGGLTSKVEAGRTTPKPIQDARLWLQLFDPNGTYPSTDIQANATPLEWLPWFFLHLNQRIKKKYPETKTPMEPNTSYWAFLASSEHNKLRYDLDYDWTAVFLKAFMHKSTKIYPNRIDINNMDYLTNELKTKQDEIHQRQQQGHLNLLDETGFPDLDTLITSISYTGICGHITLLLRLLIYAVPPGTRTDGQAVMAIALKALTSRDDSTTLIEAETNETKKKKTLADWKKIMAMISWSIWGKMEANSGNTLVDLIKDSFPPSKGKPKKARLNRTYTQVTPDSIIALLQPRGILDPSHISFDTARFFMHRMGIQLKKPRNLVDGKAIRKIAWVAYNSYIMYRLSNVFDPTTVTAMVDLTGESLDKLVASHFSIYRILLSPSSSLNPTSLITLATHSLGPTMLEKVGYDIRGRSSKTINMALSSLFDFLSRSSMPDLLSRRFGFYVQKVDAYRTHVLRLNPLFHNTAMTAMTATELRNSLLTFSKSLFRPLSLSRYFSQPTGKTNSRIQIRWEALFNKLNVYTGDPPEIKYKLKQIQLESLLLWVYTMQQQPVARIVNDSIMKAGLLVSDIPNALMDREEELTTETAAVFNALQTALIPPAPAPVPTFTDYFRTWRLYSAPILKISTVGRVLAQSHVTLAKLSDMVILGDDSNNKNPFSSPPLGEPNSLFTFLKQFYMPSLSMLQDFLKLDKLVKKNT